MSELIDRREAIDRFNVIRPVDPKKDEYTKGIDVGMAMCIVAVKDQPTIQPQSTTGQLNDGARSTDLIYRGQAIDAAKDWYEGLICGSINGLIKRLNALPTVQPEPQEGHWIEGKIYRDVIECNCSECGQLMTTAATVRMSFCPNCGAKMKGER